MTRKYFKSQRGFTIIELLTTMVIISVLAAVSIVAFNGVRKHARVSRVENNVSEIVVSLDNYASDNHGQYPALVTYHNSLPPSGSYSTTPAPPPDPTGGTPVTLKWMGNAIIGGSPGLKDTGNPLQDDFFTDEMPAPPDTESLFRNRLGEPDYGDGPMSRVDELSLNGHFDAYPENPLAGPGVPMVNIAHLLYLFDTGANDFRWVDITVDSIGETRNGLCAARPSSQGVYEPIEIIWDQNSYPQGDFAYIPFNLTSFQGRRCEGYWIISYGDLNTLENSDYNKYALDRFANPIDPSYANWPNLPPPYGDGIASTPPAPGTFEFEVKRMVQGALDVRATIFEDQLTVTVQ